MSGINGMNHIFDDFPLSPDCWADPAAYYEAFIKAEELTSSISTGKKVDDRTIYELTRHLFLNRSKSDALFRASLGAAQAQAAVWLSRVRSIAEWYSAAVPLPEFSGLDRDALREISGLSARSSFVEQVSQVLLERGVILVHERGLPGMKVDGVSFKLASGNPVLGLSLRYSRLDYYWFTLMHELAHVVLHSEILSAPILDDLDEERTSLIERQADRLASDALIPKNEWRSCPARYTLNEADVVEFAKKLGIAPQIVAGRIRHDLRRHELFPDLIKEVNMRSVLFGED